MPVKVQKKNADIVSAYICDLVNETVRQGRFLSNLKDFKIMPVFNESFRGSKKTINVLVFYPLFRKTLKK